MSKDELIPAPAPETEEDKTNNGVIDVITEDMLDDVNGGMLGEHSKLSAEWVKG